jgi:hypothetical protein
MTLRHLLCMSMCSLVFSGLAQAGVTIPAPIQGRVRMVGGIESLVIDGTVHYFGFSYGDDLVLSPLIDAPATMAAFAARHMRQRDGVHDEKYWQELVKESVTNSELASDVADRTIKRAVLRHVVSQLGQAERKNQRVHGLSIPYHLLYLLDASKEGDLPLTFTEEFKRLDFGDTDSPVQTVLDCIDYLNGKTKLPRGASYRDAAYVARVTLDSLANAGPANWPELFSVLRAEK